MPGMIEALHLVMLGKLLLAAALGSAIGAERELAGKPAGLRTNILICMGSALFTQLSISMAMIGFANDGKPYGDTTRITAQIVSGIGFLGAGAILHGGGAVIGLTTAATIWLVAAVGSAVGAGMYVEAVGTTTLVVVVLVGLRPVEHLLASKRRRLHATVRVKPGVQFDEVAKVIAAHGVHVYTQRTFEHDSDRTFELDLIGATKQFDALCDGLRSEKDVISITTD
jgi:putative Mg2+ transporter-C (MgtC) family protein